MTRRLDQQAAEDIATATPAPTGMLDVRDRVVEFRRIPATELQDNAGNWREHPLVQRQVLRGVMEHIGIAGALLVYHSERNGGRITLVDGHLRKGDYPGIDWPCLVLDVNDQEADLLLATHDPIAALAATNKDKLTELLAELRANASSDVDELLRTVAASQGAVEALEFAQAAQVPGEQHAAGHTVVRVQVRSADQVDAVIDALKQLCDENAEWNASVAV